MGLSEYWLSCSEAVIRHAYVSIGSDVDRLSLDGPT